jgi:glycosyltransferase involved in cell wall biosynthesis
VICRSVGNDILRPWQGYPFRMLASIVGARKIERLVRSWLEHGHYPEWAEMLCHKARVALMRDSARAHQRVLANSEFTRGLLLDLGVEPDRIMVVTGGVDARRFRRPDINKSTLRAELGLPEDAFILLTACRFVAKKGVDLLLQALTELRRDLPVYLVVAGDGRNRAKYEVLAADLGISAQVAFRGRIEHGRIERFFWAADAFVLASRESVNPYTGTRDLETMGRVLCEANAAGLPVIASSSGGIPSVVSDGDNGLLFPEGDLAGLIEAVRRLAGDRGLAHNLAGRGIERAATAFDWSVIMQHHERAFSEAMATA